MLTLLLQRVPQVYITAGRNSINDRVSPPVSFNLLFPGRLMVVARSLILRTGESQHLPPSPPHLFRTHWDTGNLGGAKSASGILCFTALHVDSGFMHASLCVYAMADAYSVKTRRDVKGCHLKRGNAETA